MFAYCGNNPVNYVDFTGERSVYLVKPNPADMVAAFDYNAQTGETIAVNCSELIDSGFENVTIESTIELNLTLKENNIQSKLEIANFLAQCAYESDWGSGLTERGSDVYFAGKSYGKKYRGAGYIQCTGAANYAWDAAGWWWNQAGMNRRINSGYTVNNVSGMVTAWDKNDPNYGSYIDRVNNYNKIYGILR